MGPPSATPSPSGAACCVGSIRDGSCHPPQTELNGIRRTSYRPPDGSDDNPNWGWHEAGQWAAGLTVTINGVTYSDWRLPSAGANPQSGYNQTTPEMGHLYYVELGNLAYPTPGWGLQNVGPFEHLTSYFYWSAERFTLGSDSAWVFAFSGGSHSCCGHTDLPYYALAVRAGDVVSVSATSSPTFTPTPTAASNTPLPSPTATNTPLPPATSATATGLPSTSTPTATRTATRRRTSTPTAGNNQGDEQGGQGGQGNQNN